MATFSVRPDIDAAAAKLPSTVGAKREIQKLPEVLWEGELVEMLATGLYGKGNGLLVMTSQRLLFFFHGLTRQQVEDFPYSRISSVQWQNGMLSGTLTVFSSGNAAEIKQVPKREGKALADRLRQRLAEGSPSASSAAAASPVQDVGARLATLDQLLAQGAITAAEHGERRARILDSL